ncbi:MAG: hypothetical protein V3V01_10765 [Acidimicrobiales bacterium]
MTLRDPITGQLRTRAVVGEGCDVTVVATGTADAPVQAANPNLRLMGYSIGESNTPTGADAQATLRHGTSVAGPELVLVELIADDAETVWFGPNGIKTPNGIFLERPSGETTAVVFHEIVP